MARSAYRRQYNQNIVDCIQLCGWDVIYLSDIYDSPFSIRIYNGNESYNLSIYGWGLTHGGGSRNPDEYRIQVHVPQFYQTPGFKTLVLGWWQQIEVFAGFDVRKHLGLLGNSPSIQISRDRLQRGALNGMATHTKENDEIAVAFRPDFFVEYVRNLEDLHNFGQSQQDTAELETLIQHTTEDQDYQVNDAEVQQVSQERRTVVQTLTKKIRENGFKKRILTAYSHSCAFCSIQLNLIDAAHIIPVAEDDSTDYTSNGIALCSIHHRAYDKALITFNEEYETLLNLDNIRQLAAVRRSNKIDDFINNLRPMIALPPNITERPHTAFIARANKIRGWSFTNIQRIV